MPLSNLIVTDQDDFSIGDGVNGDGMLMFEDFQGAFQPKEEQLEVHVRLGFDGESTRKTGVRGDPFPLLSIHYVADRSAAKSAIEAYLSLIDGNPYEFYQHGTSFGFYKVLKLNVLPLIACGSVVGALLQELTSPITPTIILVCEWLLVSTVAPEEP